MTLSRPQRSAQQETCCVAAGSIPDRGTVPNPSRTTRVALQADSEPEERYLPLLGPDVTVSASQASAVPSRSVEPSRQPARPRSLAQQNVELSSAPTWTGWYRPPRPRYPSQGPGTRVPRPRPLCPKAPRPGLCDVPEPGGGGHARTHEGTGQPRRRQGVVAGHGTKVRGWDRICREAGTRGVWGDRPGSCQEAAGERPARGLPAQSACTERGVRSEGPGIQELEGGGCQGTNRGNSAVWGPGLATDGEGGCAEAFCY